MKKVRVAQIGTSQYSHGNDIWKSMAAQSGLYELVGYAMPENEREKYPDRLKAFEGYREMTVEEILLDPTIDAVAVETEEKYLTKYALRVAKAKKHIHMEKPGGCEPAEFEELIKTVKENGLVFHVGYMYRYNPFIREVVQKAKDGALGEIISVEAQMSCIEPPALRRQLGDYPGGMMFFLGCHLVDLVLQIQGRPQRILPLSGSTHREDIHTTDYGMAVFEYPNGVSFVKTNGYEIGGFERRQLVVTGSEGTVELKPLEWYEDGLPTTVKAERFDPSWHRHTPTVRSERFDRYDAMMAAFASYVRGEKDDPYTPDYELELYKTLTECCGGIR